MFNDDVEGQVEAFYIEQMLPYVPTLAVEKADSLKLCQSLLFRWPSASPSSIGGGVTEHNQWRFSTPMKEYHLLILSLFQASKCLPCSYLCNVYTLLTVYLFAFCSFEINTGTSGYFLMCKIKKTIKSCRL